MRRIAALSVLAASALALAACDRPAEEAPGGMDAPPPADAPAAAPAADPAAPFRVDFSASGTEPFWRVDIKGTDITLSGPVTETIPAPHVAANAGLAATGDAATWTAQAGTTPVVVKVTKGDCSDGMSDLTYPYSAEVSWGGQTLKGCGFPTAEQPREGQ
jgi:uncharacterized membrane protein